MKNTAEAIAQLSLGQTIFVRSTFDYHGTIFLLTKTAIDDVFEENFHGKGTKVKMRSLHDVDDWGCLPDRFLKEVAIDAKGVREVFEDYLTTGGYQNRIGQTNLSLDTIKKGLATKKYGITVTTEHFEKREPQIRVTLYERGIEVKSLRDGNYVTYREVNGGYEVRKVTDDNITNSLLFSLDEVGETIETLAKDFF